MIAYPSSFLCLLLLAASAMLVDRSVVGMMLCLVTSNSVTCWNPGWRKAEERNSWHSIIKHSAGHFNKKAEGKEKCLGDGRERLCEQRLIEAVSLLHCTHPGCSFQTFNKAGLISQQRCHSTTSRIPCQFCH